MNIKFDWILNVLILFCVMNHAIIVHSQTLFSSSVQTRVLDYFKNNAIRDSLKYKSALFLIKNMPYNYSIYGENVQEYEDSCQRIAFEPQEIRSQKYLQYSNSTNTNNWHAISDIKKLDAGYLINYVNETVDMWLKQPWSKNYSCDDFINYVLPYRVSYETLSDWRHTISTEYPYLNSEYFWSNRGVRFNYLQAELDSACVGTLLGTSNDSIIVMKSNSSAIFNLYSTISTNKLLNLRYSSENITPLVCISVNGKILKTIRLKRTMTKNHFRKTNFGLPVHFEPGNNKVSIKLLDGSINLDYVEVSAYEKLEHDKLVDFSKCLYKIRNRKSGKCVVLDTLEKSLLVPIVLKRTVSDTNSILFKFDYLGYPSWKISPYGDSNSCIENRWVSLAVNNELTKYKYNRGNHQKWVIIPIDGKYFKILNKDSGLCWDYRHDERNSEDVLVQNFYNNQSSQQWELIPMNKRDFISCSLFALNNAASSALKVTDVMEQFEYIPSGGILLPSLSNLCKYRTGTCQEEATYTVALSRYLGIPTCIDFTPHWGNRTNSHSWCALILPNGKSTPFYMGCAPGDTIQYFHSYLKPKVYRCQFKLNKLIESDLRQERLVPPLFRMPKFIDVTKEYCQTADIERVIPIDCNMPKILYICVFDKMDWSPVAYSKVQNGVVHFDAMGINILYSLGYWDKGKITPIGNPFILKSQGQILEIKANPSNTQTVKLWRKYPFFGKEDFFNFRMNLGKFQGSNKADFSDSYTFYTHKGITEGGWYEQDIKCDKTFKYLRYLSPNDSHGNINELEFYDDHGYKLFGEIIGTNGLVHQDKETVFDGNILTGFNSDTPNGNWVGIKLDTPSKITKIKYIARNDGNSIEIGDVYQLLYYDAGIWRIVSEKTATNNYIQFDNVPLGGLYLLKDLTKGNEERIFTYENDKQIWW